MAKRFDLRRSPVDGMFRRWELRWASSIKTPDGEPAFEDAFAAREHRKPGDFKVQVCTGVFKSRKEVFARKPGD